MELEDQRLFDSLYESLYFKQIDLLKLIDSLKNIRDIDSVDSPIDSVDSPIDSVNIITKALEGVDRFSSSVLRSYEHKQHLFRARICSLLCCKR